MKTKYEISIGKIKKETYFSACVYINRKVLRKISAETEELAKEKLLYFAKHEYENMKFTLGIDRVELGPQFPKEKKK